MEGSEIQGKSEDSSSLLRTYVYVDGFNLFYGMKSSKLRRYYWLNLESLSHGFIREPKTTLALVKYFTARIKGNPEKERRQETYLAALQTCPLVRILEGSYVLEPNDCPNCWSKRNIFKEKQTDTNISAEMVADAFLDRWDIAYLISGDADLVPPIRMIKDHFPSKMVIIVNPPSRSSRELFDVFRKSFWINETMLKDNQFPDTVLAAHGELKRPEKWQ